jgi:AraC-like DNA-binding protein
LGIFLSLNRGITIKDLVTRSGLSIKTFVRRYTEAFGIEPAEELRQLRQLRLGEAKRLLMETDQSVSEIATALGFASQASFYN